MKKNILIVEDELLIAEDIKMNLELLHYNVIGVAIKATEALKIIEENEVHLALLDINIKGEIDGIELGEKIKSKYPIPIVYLTSNSDRRTVERAVLTQPAGYVVKPYNKTDLFTTLAVALHDHDTIKNGDVVEKEEKEEAMTQTNVSSGVGKSAFFKVDGTYTKIAFDQILYFRTAGNYIEIYTLTGVSLVRLTVRELFEIVASGNFIRIHKSYILNQDKITGFNGREVLMRDKVFPMGGVYKDQVFESLDIK